MSHLAAHRFLLVVGVNHFLQEAVPQLGILVTLFEQVEIWELLMPDEIIGIVDKQVMHPVAKYCVFDTMDVIQDHLAHNQERMHLGGTISILKDLVLE